MRTYSDTLFTKLRARGWSVHLLAYVDRDHRRVFCADAQRGDSRPYIARGESMIAALLDLDTQCQAAEWQIDRPSPPEPLGPAQPN